MSVGVVGHQPDQEAEVAVEVENVTIEDQFNSHKLLYLLLDLVVFFI